MTPSMLPGSVIGNRWRITESIGSGGFGQVFRCVDQSHIGLGDAAVKLLHPNTSPQERNEFLREVQKIAQLRHQNLVGYLDSGLQTIGDEIHPYLVTELCQGSLADLLEQGQGTLDLHQTVDVLVDVTTGLAHLHAGRLVHRDIKPGNVLRSGNNWKLGDFGLMRDLTATGSYHRGHDVTGTPAFMAPEMLTSTSATALSDVYAVGVLAHVCLTGRPLHIGSGPALIQAITTTQPTVDPVIDARLRQLIMLAAAPDPQTRVAADILRDHLVHEDWSRTDSGLFGSPTIDVTPKPAVFSPQSSPNPHSPHLPPAPQGLTPQPFVDRQDSVTPMPYPAATPPPPMPVDFRHRSTPTRAGRNFLMVVLVSLATIGALVVLLIAGIVALIVRAEPAVNDPATGEEPILPAEAPADSEQLEDEQPVPIDEDPFSENGE